MKEEWAKWRSVAVGWRVEAESLRCRECGSCYVEGRVSERGECDTVCALSVGWAGGWRMHDRRHSPKLTRVLSLRWPARSRAEAAYFTACPILSAAARSATFTCSTPLPAFRCYREFPVNFCCTRHCCSLVGWKRTSFRLHFPRSEPLEGATWTSPHDGKFHVRNSMHIRRLGCTKRSRFR